MSGVQIKKQKLTENSIQYSWPVDDFKTQYQTCLLLLAHGIPGLPYDLMYLIVKKYVYVKPLRISLGCTLVQSMHIVTGELRVWTEHEIYNFPQTYVTYFGTATREKHFERWTHEQIAAWFEKHHFQVPEHFLPQNVKGCLPQH